MSHYSQLVLPPLFALMNNDLGIDYALLGLIITFINASAAIAQTPIGFLVDRFGARTILISGLIIKTLAIGAMALTNSYEIILVLAIIAGLGHAVFHPADYSILMSSIDERRIGKAFSFHTASGTAGTAAGPLVTVLIAEFWDWKIAVLSVAALGIVTGLAMILQGGIIKDHIGHKKKTKTRLGITDGMTLLLKPSMLFLYLFFLTTAMISIGLNGFTVVILIESYGTPLVAAGAALTTFATAGVIGVLCGGVIADKTERHDLVAVGAFSSAALVTIFMASYDLHHYVILVCFAAIGWLLGLVRPARDMMVRAETPDGNAGKVFGFMSTGHQVGGVFIPVTYGWIIDQGKADWIFWITAILMLTAMLTLINPGRKS
ncbi:MAG: hypothetical protein CMM52_05660 [Rhodospirillaceae bacterium]|nr:hypothetical protein [Rhodospirillaceae bacterium]